MHKYTLKYRIYTEREREAAERALEEELEAKEKEREAMEELMRQVPGEKERERDREIESNFTTKTFLLFRKRNGSLRKPRVYRIS